MSRTMTIDAVRDVLRRESGTDSTSLTDVEANGFIESGCDRMNVLIRPNTKYYVTDRDSSSAAIYPAITDAEVFRLLCLTSLIAWLTAEQTKASLVAVNLNSPAGHVDTRERAALLSRRIQTLQEEAQAAADEIKGRYLSEAAIAYDGQDINPDRNPYA